MKEKVIIRKKNESAVLGLKGKEKREGMDSRPILGEIKSRKVNRREGNSRPMVYFSLSLFLSFSF